MIKRRVGNIQEIAHCEEVKMSFTRKKPAIHIHAIMKDNPSYEQTHRIHSLIETEVRHVMPNSRISIHSQPEKLGDVRALGRIVKDTIDAEPGSRGVQNVHFRTDGMFGLDILLVTNVQSSRFDASIDQKLKAADHRISEIVIHKLSVAELVANEMARHGSQLRWFIEHVARRFPDLKQLHPPTIRRTIKGLIVSIPVSNLHGGTAAGPALANAIKQGYPGVADVKIMEAYESTVDNSRF